MNNKITRKEFITKVATVMGTTKVDAEIAIDAVIGELKQIVLDEDKICFQGFMVVGTKTVKETAERTINPFGKGVQVYASKPEHSAPTATFSKNIKDELKSK